jgi:Protein of unknown function (DUF3179)
MLKRMIRLALAGALVLAVAGCGGEEEAEQREAGTVSALEEELSALRVRNPGLTNGFTTDFSKRAVPLSEFQSGGPGKDGIPAIDEPRFVATEEVDFLEPKEPVVAAEVHGRARAYPIQILIWHEIVNDTLGGVPIAVTFCPLCNTAIVFDRRLGKRILEFGTTGNLRNSDLVMYDRQTESWWQQFGGRALVGELTGSKLEQLPGRIVAWRDFRAEHPGGQVLSRETGYERPYGQNPYQGYDDVDTSPFFPAANSTDDRLPPKERVVFVERGGEAVAIPFSALRARKVVRVQVGGHRLIVRWRAGVASSLDEEDIAEGRDVGTAEVLEGGRLVAFDQPFWFAVAAFRPDVRIVR